VVSDILGRPRPAFGYREPGPPPSHRRHQGGWRGASAQTSLSTGLRLLLPHVPWGPTLDASPARRALVYASDFRKIILYGESGKATHRHTNQVRFCTFFSDLVRIGPPPPPAGRRGPGRPPSRRRPLPRPAWAGAGGTFLGGFRVAPPPPGHPPAYRAPGRAYAPAAGTVRKSGLWRAEWARVGPPGGAWRACSSPSKLGDATRKRGEATREPAGPPVSARPRPPQAGPRRPGPPAAPLHPQRRSGGREGAERR
jgi:hypothetical protein